MKRVTLYDACESCCGLGHLENCSCNGTVAFLRGCCRSCKGEGSKPVGVGLLGDNGQLLREIRRGPDGKIVLRDGDRTYTVKRKKT